MSKKPSKLPRLVLLTGGITLLVSVLRLVGQLWQWPATLVGSGEAGGGGALLGISWLLFVVGAWLGLHEQGTDKARARPGRTLLLAGLALIVAFGGVALCTKLDLLWFPDEEHPGEPRGMAWFVGAFGLGTLLSIVAWPRIGLAMLAYAALARLPVVAITWLALHFDWQGTHYTQIPAFFEQPAEADRFAFLASAQLTFWPMLTVLFGTASAAVAGLLRGKPKS